MILILGVTASGKGRLAYDLAQSLDAEIISIDSMKVYRRMDIGTAKPPLEARRRIKYHLIDIVEPSDSFSVGAFRDAALHAIEQINNRRKKIIAVGGTALYIKAMLYGLFEGPGTDQQIRAELQKRAKEEGLADLHQELAKIDPIASERIHPNDSKRIIRALEVYKLTGKPISNFQQQWDKHDTQSCPGLSRRDAMRNTKNDWTLIGLRREKAEESKRINSRAKKIIEAGLVDEVKALLAEEKPLSKQARCAIGYAEVIEYLNGSMQLENAIELIKKNTRRLAKNQRTWFKTFQNVNWLDVGPDETAENILDRTKKLIK